MVDKIKDLINEKDKTFVRDMRLNHDERFNDKGFIDFMWDKYQLHIAKLDVQERMQDLVTQMDNKTFKPEPDKKIVAVINGHEKISYIKDSIQRRWAILNKQLRDIERKERGGFIIKMGDKNINANI